MPTTITLDGARSGAISRFLGRTFTRRARTAAYATCPSGCWPETQDGRTICGCADTPLKGADDRGKWLTGPALAGPVGDVWSEGSGDAPSPLADFTASAIGWGILAFAAGTLAYRGYGAIKKRF
jgi:hypothetical protein